MTDEKMVGFKGSVDAGFASLASETDRKPLGVALDRLIAVVVQALNQLDLSKLDEATKVAIAKYVDQMYDTHIRPIDLPYVPNFVEPSVDDALNMALNAVVAKLLGL